MKGNASHWFKFWSQKSKNPSREDFTIVLNKRFGARECNTVLERLATIRQNDKAEDYICEFEILCHKIHILQKIKCRDISLQGYNLTFEIKFDHMI